ncbi:MAG: DUF962 domain-containing protein [Gammaproteobacteria bacterium]|nr:DUF962 domain-containing protein [Gammaproteobacteria bacterium]
MKTLEQQMAVYAAYHRHPLNRLTHFLGVPAIIVAILIPMGWLRIPVFGVEVSLAVVFVATVLVYYTLLDARLAGLMVLFMLAMLAVTEWVAVNLAVRDGLQVAAIAFIGGWIFQIIGHVFEGRRPALVDNGWQIFVAPIFLLAEALFALGYRRDTEDRVQELANRH